jgi:hypothetical protein
MERIKNPVRENKGLVSLGGPFENPVENNSRGKGKQRIMEQMFQSPEFAVFFEQVIRQLEEWNEMMHGGDSDDTLLTRNYEHIDYLAEVFKGMQMQGRTKVRKFAIGGGFVDMTLVPAGNVPNGEKPGEVALELLNTAIAFINEPEQFYLRIIHPPSGTDKGLNGFDFYIHVINNGGVEQAALLMPTGEEPCQVKLNKRITLDYSDYQLIPLPLDPAIVEKARKWMQAVYVPEEDN